MNTSDSPPGVVFSQWNYGWTIEALIQHEVCGAAGLLTLIVQALLAVEVWQLLSKGAIPPPGIAICMLGLASAAVLFGCLFLVTAFGRIQITNDHGQGSLFTGVGSVGYTRHFQWSRVTNVQLEPIAYRNGEIIYRIKLVGADIAFGNMLQSIRCQWVATTLQSMLAYERRNSKSA